MQKDIKVMIVEDTREFREEITNILNNTEGYQCIGSFANCNEALRRLCDGTADVVLMDIQLKGSCNGIECIKKLQPKCAAHTQFMMLTTFNDDDKIFDSLRAGATGYVLKKDKNKILSAIIELAEGGSPMSPEIARRLLLSFRKMPDKDLPIKLTPREIEVLELLAKGLFYKEIADELKKKGGDDEGNPIRLGTVKQYAHSIYKKLHVCNRVEALREYFNLKHFLP